MASLFIAMVFLGLALTFITRKVPGMGGLTRRILSLQWRLLRAVLRWLHRPDMERQGGGRLLPPRFRYGDDERPSEEPWA